MSDSSLPGVASSPVYRPLTRTCSLVPPSLSIDASSSSNTDPPTSLSLSLPGSDSCEASNQAPGSGSVPGANNDVNSAHMVQTPAVASQPNLPVQQQLQQAPAAQQEFGVERQFFNPEFLAVMQEMIRKEVRNYMSGIEHNGLCLQTEAIRNAVVKRIGISRIE